MTPGDVLGLPPGRCGFVKNQRRHSLWIHRREGHRDETAVARRENHRPLRAGSIQNREKVVDERLDRRDVSRCKALRAAEPTSVGDDQTRKARELTRESRECRVFPVDDDVRPESLEIDEVKGNLSNALVGEWV